MMIHWPEYQPCYVRSNLFMVYHGSAVLVEQTYHRYVDHLFKRGDSCVEVARVTALSTTVLLHT